MKGVKGGIPGQNLVQTGAVKPKTDSFPEPVAKAAVRGAKALAKMQQADVDAVMGRVPGTVPDIASKLVGGAFDQKILNLKVGELSKLIRNSPSMCNKTVASGGRVGDLRDAVQDVRHMQSKGNLVSTARALAQIAMASKATPEQFERLVGRLELLQQLNGTKAFSMVSDKDLRAKVQQLTNGNLQTLTQQVGDDLSRLAYDPVEREARAKQAL